jgi:hypothetical protein
MQTTRSVRPSDGDLVRKRAELRADIAARLRAVCAGWPVEEFERIVDRVTDTTLKYAEPASDPTD